jgi:hypothetical protein
MLGSGVGATTSVGLGWLVDADGGAATTVSAGCAVRSKAAIRVMMANARGRVGIRLNCAPLHLDIAAGAMAMG